jgi:hypothetical protein
MRRGNKIGRSASMPTGLVGMFNGVVEDPIREEEDALSTISDDSAHSAKQRCQNARLWAETRMMDKDPLHKGRKGFFLESSRRFFQLLPVNNSSLCRLMIQVNSLISPPHRPSVGSRPEMNETP